MNPQIVDKIANLAQIEVNDSQKTQKALEDIFELINQMHDINTDNIQPLYFPLDILGNNFQHLREDVNSENNISLKETMKVNSPLSDKDFYLVPNVIE